MIFIALNNKSLEIATFFEAKEYSVRENMLTEMHTLILNIGAETAQTPRPVLNMGVY